jgi:hypothetical protein
MLADFADIEVNLLAIELKDVYNGIDDTPSIIKYFKELIIYLSDNQKDAAENIVFVLETNRDLERAVEQIMIRCGAESTKSVLQLFVDALHIEN